MHHNKHKLKSHPPSSNDLPTNIDEAIQQASNWQRHLLQHYRIHDVHLLIDTIHNSTNENPLLIVSDGGLKDDVGTFGVSMGTKTIELCSIEGPVSGTSSMLTSFRSEAFGMLAGISFLRLFLLSHNISLLNARTIYLFCDNLALVNFVQRIIEGVHYPRMYLKSEADVIMQIKDELEALRSIHITISLEHVKGHLYDHIPYIDLSREAQMNIDADVYATNYMIQQGPQYDYTFFLANPISITINDDIITRDLKRLIRQASRSPAVRLYMIGKFNWHESTPDKIWWQIHGSSIQSFSRNDRKRIRKFIFNWLPTNERLLRQGETDNDQCLSCDNNVETHNHILRCPCAQRAIIKDTWLKKLKVLLDDKYAPRIMNELIYNHIVTSYTYSPHPMIPILSTDIQQAYNDQQQIGWDQLLRGRLAFRWGTIVATHLSTNEIPESEMTALIWGRQLVRLGFQLTLDLWNNRNTTAHQPNDRNESKEARRRILSKIEALQSSIPEVRYCDRHFVYQPLDTLATYSLCNLISWHRQAVSIIQRQQQYTRTQPDIRTVFLAHSSTSGDTAVPPVDLAPTLRTISTRIPDTNTDTLPALAPGAP